MKAKLKAATDYLLARLGEQSTWRGLILVLTGIGVTVEPDQASKIIAGGLAIVGVINIFRQGSPTRSEVESALAAKQDKQ